MSDDNAIDLTDAGAFRHWERVTISYSDQDPMGHVNNGAYGVWFEVARVGLIERYLDAAPDWLDTVLARVTINYLNETRFPGEVRVGARLLSIGNRSFRSGYAIFRDEACLATADCINVFFDMRSRSSTVPTDAVRQVMERDLAGD